MTPTPNPTAEQIEAVLMFAERGYLQELGAIDPRHQYSGDETDRMRERFENYRNGVSALRAHGQLSEGAPSEEQIEAATWALIDWDTDIVDRGVRDEHYRERRAEVERIAPILAAYVPAPTPSEWEREALLMAILEASATPPRLDKWETTAGNIVNAVMARGFRLTPPAPAREEWEYGPRDADGRQSHRRRPPGPWLPVTEEEN